jgi:hypothetical protein
MNNFHHADFIIFLFNFSQKIADKVTKICLYRKSEKSGVLNIKEGLQIPNNLEICNLYTCNLLCKYVKKYISIQASIFLFISSVLKVEFRASFAY